MTKLLRQVVDLLLVGDLYTLAELGVLITVFCGEFWDCSLNKVSCSEQLKKLSVLFNFNSAINRAGPIPSIRARRLIIASAHSPASPTRLLSSPILQISRPRAVSVYESFAIIRIRLFTSKSKASTMK
jgi:hypothetical protein